MGTLKDHTSLWHQLLAEISSEPGWKLSPSLSHIATIGNYKHNPVKKKPKSTTKPTQTHQNLWKSNHQTSWIQFLGEIFTPSCFVHANQRHTNRQGAESS